MNKIKLFFISVLLIVVLTGCGNTIPVQNKPIIEQQNLLQLCGTDTPLPTNFIINDKGEKVYNGAEVYTVLREWQAYYNFCASIHNQLVRTIIGTQEIKEIPKK